MFKSRYLPIARQRIDPAEEELERINTLIRTARTNWFGLLSYLAFVGVTLMGVKDEDFFILTRETELPLVGVSIPTSLFFYTAPLLGAALYVHLHVYLLKLWKALSEAPDTLDGAPLGERITPWLITDMALRRRPGARHSYPLARLASAVAALLVFWAAPLVLAFFWLRSLPKHDELLTVAFCGLSFIAALYAGLHSYTAMRRAARASRVGSKPKARNLASPVTAAFALITTAAGWMFTESFAGYDDTLYSANLAGVDFIGLPADWKTYDEAEKNYRRTWCKREGMTMAACGWGPRSDTPPRPYQAAQRTAYCSKLHLSDVTTAICSAHFKRLDATYLSDWKAQRKADIAQLPNWSARRADLRGANLRSAKMQGADLSYAQMQGADLRGAQMQGANLRGAQMQGANLRYAQMQGADLSGAKMQGADLFDAKMQGANLSGAQMQGANLRYAQMDSSTNLTEALLRGASVRFVDDNTITQLAPFLQGMFADGYVTLPKGTARPAHWPDGKLSYRDFTSEHQKWLADPDTYTPPPNPNAAD